MPHDKKQPQPVMALTCPRCGRQLAAGRCELAPGRGLRCACGWSMQVVRRHRAPALRPPQALPAR
ncbi:MAG: hypothetical protein V1797_09930 [Pseudomonadota bacterium]